MAEELMEDLNLEDENVTIEVVDDVPPEDRNREPLAVSPDVGEDELASYSEKVQKRISNLQRAYHDERRAKEAADRERQEAIRYAQGVVEQNKTLVQKTNSNASLLHETWKSKTESDLENAKRAYKAAYESGDSDALLEAQEALNRTTIRHEMALGSGGPVRETPLQPEKEVVKQQEDVYTGPAPDDRAQAWAAKNPWFRKDRLMTGLVYGIHEDLISRSVHPTRDVDRYYAEIDKEMRKRFPDYSWGDSESPPRQKTPTVVSSVTRTPKGQKVALTPTQIALAKRFNIPLAEYAKQVAALSGGQNG